MRVWTVATLPVALLLACVGCQTQSDQAYEGDGSAGRAATSTEQITPLPGALHAGNRRRPTYNHPGHSVDTDVTADPASNGAEGRPDEGIEPGQGGDKFDLIVENRFQQVMDSPLSTFSIDVDTASYAKIRNSVLHHGVTPVADAVRIEEMVNYFSYNYAGPEDEHPFAAHAEVAGCPWKTGHRVVRIGIKAKEIKRDQRQPSNLVFLIDVSGSMQPANKLPLVIRGFYMLSEELGERDRVAIVVYSGAAGVVLPSTPGSDRETIIKSLRQLRFGGSTAGGEGIRLAYRIARDNMIDGGTNRVILCSDGDFNVGPTNTSELVRLVEQQAASGVYLTVLGFGIGDHNDAMMEQISNRGNGNYAFIDTEQEARKVLVDQMSGTLETVAKDVKIQVEFNPAQVLAYRQIGYENRELAAEDFLDDTKDAGDIGAGHRVTALYEIVPVGSKSDVALSQVDPLKYQKANELSEQATSDELLMVKLRYKQPNGDVSTLINFPVIDEGKRFGQASQDFKFASAVASFGMLLRRSPHKGNATYDSVLEIATESIGKDPHGYRDEFLKLIRRARRLAKHRR